MTVYFLHYGDSGPVRIGHVPDSNRIRTIDLTVLRLVENVSLDKVQQKFKRLHIRGDWFYFDERMLSDDFIEREVAA